MCELSVNLHSSWLDVNVSISICIHNFKALPKLCITFELLALYLPILQCPN
uniref:Uncharacterized protein n=1 Tax=Rhizophora mucronata TaxID=61149 RepID=A0A2P2PIT5_RHIMU